MTVGELIETLNKYPAELDVYSRDLTGTYEEVLTVTVEQNIAEGHPADCPYCQPYIKIG